MTTKSGEPSQLVFDWGARPALGAENFLLSPANSGAVALVDRWPDWPMAAVIVQGPAQCGKSHLANVWRLKSGADVVAATMLAEADVHRFMRDHALVVEDIDRGIANEPALFHLLNLAREQKGSILLTSRLAPGLIEVGLADLRSRLRALAVTPIGHPDEALLRALLVKLFTDRQLTVAPAVVATIVRHMDRSMAAAAHIVEEVDRRSLSDRRPITRALALAVLGQDHDDDMDAGEE